VKIHAGLSDKVISLGNTSIRRDWGYAPLFVDAMWRILQHSTPEDFLICSGNVMSLDNLVNSVFDKLSIDKEQYLRIDASLFRPSELNEIYGDNAKAKKELNWDYSLSNEGLIDCLIEDERHFISWKQQNNLPV
jgi:GDPmannose 4,6-dehydratase